MSWQANIRDEIRSMAPPRLRPEGGALLDANESPFGMGEEEAAALAQHLAGVRLNRYPEATARALRDHMGAELGVDPEAVVVGNGTEELVRFLCATFSKLKPRETRPRVAFPLPSPVPYRGAVLSQGARPLEMPLRDDFGLDLVAMERHITGGHPNLMLFCRPNDPTGNLWPREDMEKVISEHPDVVVAVDETYFDYCGESLIDLLAHYPHLVILRSLSKIGLAGLRVGFLVGNPSLVAEVHKVRPAFNVSALDQEAALWLLRNQAQRLQERVRQIVAERERLTQALGQVEGVQVWPSLGNFLLLRVADGPGVHRALLKRAVAVADVGEAGLAANCLRLTVGLPEENDALLRELPEALAHPEPAPPAPRHKQAEVVAGDEAEKPAPGLPKFL